MARLKDPRSVRAQEQKVAAYDARMRGELKQRGRERTPLVAAPRPPTARMTAPAPVADSDAEDAHVLDATDTPTSVVPETPLARATHTPSASPTQLAPATDGDEEHGSEHLLSRSSTAAPSASVPELNAADVLEEDAGSEPLSQPASPVGPAPAQPYRFPHPADITAFSASHLRQTWEGPDDDDVMGWGDTEDRRIEALAHKLRRDKQWNARRRAGTRNGHVMSYKELVREYKPAHSTQTWAAFLRACKPRVVRRVKQLNLIARQNNIA